MHVGDRAAMGVGFLQETSPVLNKQTWLLAQGHSTPSAASGAPSLPQISTSLPLIHRGFASQRKGAKDIPKTS